ncbi:MAG: hypothetical protein ACREP9_16720 [Candidatus Dormibacteraceae bacterium]
MLLDGASPGAEWELMPGLKLSTNSDRLRTFLTPEFRSSIGIIGSTSLLSAQHFVFAEFTAEDINKFLPAHHGQPEIALMLLETVLLWLRGFLRASWLIKDNSMSCEGAYAIYPSSGLPVSASANCLHELNITCDGKKFVPCPLTPAELRQLIEVHHKVETALFQCRQEHGEALAGQGSRIVRCFEFLQTARTAYSIPLRMAHYCSALEALFGTSTVELSHRLSERIAHMAGQSRKERLAVYAIAKDAYTLRSQVVHGAPLSKSFTPKVFDVCSKTDSMLRTILCRILADPQMLALLSGPSEGIDAFFLDRLMSPN